MYKYLKRKNNKQNKGSEIYWAHGHFSAAYVPWCGHKEHSNTTLEMENNIKQDCQTHYEGDEEGCTSTTR